MKKNQIYREKCYRFEQENEILFELGIVGF